MVGLKMKEGFILYSSCASCCVVKSWFVIWVSSGYLLLHIHYRLHVDRSALFWRGNVVMREGADKSYKETENDSISEPTNNKEYTHSLSLCPPPKNNKLQLSFYFGFWA